MRAIRRDSFDIEIVRLTNSHKVIDVTVRYDKGGRSWLTGEQGKQGIHISTATCEKSEGFTSTALFQDCHLKTLIVPAERFNAKKLAEVAAEIKCNKGASLLYGEAYTAIIAETAKRGGYTIATGDEDAYKVQSFTVGNRVQLTQKNLDCPIAWTGIVTGETDGRYNVLTDDLFYYSYVKAVDHSSTLELTGLPDATEEEQNALWNAYYKADADRKATVELAKRTRENEIQAHITALTALYPWAKALDSNTRQYVRASVNLKRELQEKWPSVRWSVTSDSFSGGDSVRVDWTDGPTVDQVQAVAEKYERGKFDGMTDYYNNDTSPYGEAVDVVLGRSKYVNTSRGFSTEAKAAVGDHPQIIDEKNNVYTILHASEIFSTKLYQFQTNDKGLTFAVFDTPEDAPAVAMMSESSGESNGVIVRENPEKGGVEIKFNSKPSEDTIASVKRYGFRWSKFQKLWYARATPERLSFAFNLAGIAEAKAEDIDFFDQQVEDNYAEICGV